MWAPNGSSWQAAYLNFNFSSTDSSSSHQGNMGMVCGVCADGAASSAPGHGLAIVGSEGASGAAAAGIESAAPRADLRMLTRAELPAHLANLIESFGAVEVFTQLLRVCPRELLQEACRRVWATMNAEEQFTAVCSHCARALCAAFVT